MGPDQADANSVYVAGFKHCLARLMCERVNLW